MACLLDHGRKSEKVAVRGFFHNNFLVVFVNARNLDLYRCHHISSNALIPDLVGALPGSKSSQVYLPSEHSALFVIKQDEQQNMPEHLRIACHQIPQPARLGLPGLRLMRRA